MDQLLVIVRGEEEAAGALVGVMPENHVQQLPGELQLLGSEADLLQLQDAIGEERVVIEIRIQMRPAVFVSGEEPAVAPERPAYEIRVRERRTRPERRDPSARQRWPCRGS